MASADAAWVQAAAAWTTACAERERSKSWSDDTWSTCRCNRDRTGTTRWCWCKPHGWHNWPTVLVDGYELDEADGENEKDGRGEADGEDKAASECTEDGEIGDV